MVNFSNISIGKTYHRDELTEIWGLGGRQAFSRGVFTPKDTNLIILFVTKEKSTSATQYKDYISDNFLYWEGENKGGANPRIINAKSRNDAIHLFYRDHYRQNFVYLGIVEYVDHVAFEDKPFQFVFEVIGEAVPKHFEEPLFHYANQETERRIAALSRVGQGAFRVNLFNLWKACSITNVKMPELLKASHIKPWKDSNNQERLDPYNGLLLTPTLDALFDRGFISFRDNGKILLSQKIEPIADLLKVSPDIELGHVFPNNKEYLAFHRDVRFYSKS